MMESRGWSTGQLRNGKSKKVYGQEIIEIPKGEKSPNSQLTQKKKGVQKSTDLREEEKVKRRRVRNDFQWLRNIQENARGNFRSAFKGAYDTNHAAKIKIDVHK